MVSCSLTLCALITFMHAKERDASVLMESLGESKFWKMEEKVFSLNLFL